MDVIYKEAVRRNRFEQFVTILKSPPKCFEENQQPGCGLSFVAKEVEKHNSVESNQLKRLELRLIGSQAISLAQHRFVY